ncbi:unnamed protein product [Heterobilharzia americana]|nr:unnamed protein product [Heterobilharzia americana]
MLHRHKTLFFVDQCSKEFPKSSLESSIFDFLEINEFAEDALFFEKLYKFAKIWSRDSFYVAPSTFDFVDNYVEDTVDAFDRFYDCLHENLKKLHDVDEEVRLAKQNSFAYNNLAFFLPSANFGKELDINTIKELSDSELALREKLLTFVTLARKQTEYIHTELVRDIARLSELIETSKKLGLKEEQTMCCREFYSRRLGNISQNPSHATVRFANQGVKLAVGLSKGNLKLVLLKDKRFETMKITSIEVNNCHSGLQIIAQTLSLAFTSSTMIACAQLQQRVDVNLTEVIQRLSSLYAFDWDPAARHLHLLARHEGMRLATLYLSIDGLIDPVSNNSLSNDEFQTYDSDCSMSLDLDQYLLTISDVFYLHEVPTSIAH